MPFRIALSGLNAASADLRVTANNIANVNTTGFKQSRAEFGDVFAVYSYGGSRNAFGAGVQLSRVAQQFTQGSVEFTDNSLDMAVAGDGFFTLSDNGAIVYSRAGAFGMNQDGYVVNAAGQRLQVFPPLANATGFDTGRLTDLRLITSDNPPSATTDVEVGLALPSNATAPPVTTFSATDPRSYNHTTSLTVYDSLGVAHVQTMFFVKGTTANTWNMHTFMDGTAVGTAQTLVYSSTGQLTTPATGSITLPAHTTTTGSDPMNIVMDLSSSTQFNERFSVNNLTQNGYTTGRLAGVAVSPEGIVSARFTNGQNTSLGELAMTRFSNPQGLQELGDTTYGQTGESGIPIRGEAGTSTFGRIQSGALEGSNVDLTSQLVNMITAQRNFQANAQMISTTDQIAQTIINIR
jgi:flagellar hook protein FlgE